MTRITIVLALSVLAQAAPAQEYEFENLGAPCVETGLKLTFTTAHPDGYDIAWGRLEGPGTQGLLGIRLDTGEKRFVDLSMHGKSHVAAIAAADGRTLYAYAGSPHAHFMRYDPVTDELTDLGAPAQNASYFAQGELAPDGRFYIGTYPRAQLVWIDIATGEMGTTGKITDSRENRYIFPSVAASDDNIIYCPVGLHHQEMYAYDPATGEATQILPDGLSAQPHSPRVWRGQDGRVYGQTGGTKYLCTPTGIDTEAEIAEPEKRRVQSGEWVFWSIGHDGAIEMTHRETGETRKLQTDYEGLAAMIYSVGDQWRGRIWGGTGFPAWAFSCDIETGKLVDHGRQTGGRIQIYDLMATPEGLLLSSYTGAHLNLWDPFATDEDDRNQKLTGGRSIDQERPIRWTRGPDGHYYIGTRPIKGHVGGGLCRVTLDPLEATWWQDPIGPQSVMGCVAIEETGQLLCATSHYGGTSSIPEEDVGYVFLWDCAEEEVVCKDMPVEGAVSYSAPVRAETGVVYGIAYTAERERIIFGWDPIERELVCTADLPSQAYRFPYLHSEPVGPDGLIVGLAGDAIYAIDPADHSVEILARHDSISKAHGFSVTEDGVLYYGSGAELWRCDLLP